MSGIELEKNLTTKRIPYNIKKIIHSYTCDNRKSQSNYVEDYDKPPKILDYEYDKMNSYQKDLYELFWNQPIYRSKNAIHYFIKKYIDCECDWERFIDNYDYVKGFDPEMIRDDFWIKLQFNLFPNFDKEKEFIRLRKILEEQHNRAQKQIQTILENQKLEEEKLESKK